MYTSFQMKIHNSYLPATCPLLHTHTEVLTVTQSIKMWLYSAS